jgi:hypothetical protein
MKKILAKKKVQSAKTAGYRKKTHFSKKEKLLVLYQGNKKPLRIKRITSSCYGRLKNLDHSPVEKLPGS